KRTVTARHIVNSPHRPVGKTKYERSAIIRRRELSPTCLPTCFDNRPIREESQQIDKMTRLTDDAPTADAWIARPVGRRNCPAVSVTMKLLGSRAPPSSAFMRRPSGANLRV